MFKKYLQSAFFVVTVLQLAGCGGGNGTDAGSTQPTAVSTQPTAVNGVAQTEFTPSFTNDGGGACGQGSPQISNNSVTLSTVLSGSDAGRVVSNEGYKNISQISATVDLSQMTQNYVNATFYMVSNPDNPSLQPKGDNYCDAGGNNAAWNCREIDFLETNGNKITQATLHLGGGTNTNQRFEYAFAETANADGFNYSAMPASVSDADYGTPYGTIPNGLHSLVGIIDMTQPFDVVATFTYGSVPAMVVAYSQDGRSVEVYNSSSGGGAQGSTTTMPISDLATSMANGYWLNVSLWQGYSPTVDFVPWWNNSVSWGGLCGATNTYTISNIQVTAESEL
tara:strand:- start:97 stop:1107 length:1011 start_codon:yes stop_codon:yes gene_type:complete